MRALTSGCCESHCLTFLRFFALDARVYLTPSGAPDAKVMTLISARSCGRQRSRYRCCPTVSRCLAASAMDLISLNGCFGPRQGLRPSHLAARGGKRPPADPPVAIMKNVLSAVADERREPTRWMAGSAPCLVRTLDLYSLQSGRRPGGRVTNSNSYGQGRACSLSDEEDAAASINRRYTSSSNFCRVDSAISFREGVWASRARA
jgi:hypothetical protein